MKKHNLCENLSQFTMLSHSGRLPLACESQMAQIICIKNAVQSEIPNKIFQKRSKLHPPRQKIYHQAIQSGCSQKNNPHRSLDRVAA